MGKKRRFSIQGEKLKEAYNLYFGLSLIHDLGKKWAPEFCCTTCKSSLLGWMEGKNRHLSFGIPRIWREPRHHGEGECYFCSVKIHSGKKANLYPNLPSSIAPVEHSSDLPIPPFPKKARIESDISDDKDSSDEFLPNTKINNPILIDDKKFDQISKDLRLSKRASIKLLSHLKQNNLTKSEVTEQSIKNRSYSLSLYFSKENEFCFCHNIPQLIEHLHGDFNSADWILFIDGSMKSLKAVLLHKENNFPAIPVTYAKGAKESYENFQYLLSCISYNTHNFKICGDFKVILFHFNFCSLMS